MRWLTVPFLFACSNKPNVANSTSVESTDSVESPRILPSSEVTAVSQPTVSPEDITVAIQDIDVLKELENTHSFAQLLPHLQNTTMKGVSTKWLYDNHQGYRLIAEHVKGRIDTISSDIQRDLIIELKDALK
jgi:hypothetical protein